MHSGGQELDPPRLHHCRHKDRQDHRAHEDMCWIVLLDAGLLRGGRFTSFREIHISVMLAVPREGRPVIGSIHLGVIARHETIQVKYTNQNVPRWTCGPTRSSSEAVAHSKRSGKRTMLLVQIVGRGHKRPCPCQRRALLSGSAAVWLFLDQIKRDKGVWWMPWQ